MRKIFSSWRIHLISIILLTLTFTLFSFFLKTYYEGREISENKKSQPENSSVLGSYKYREPQIFISGGDQGYSSGGIIALSSTDEPAVVIGGYNISGDAEISMYEADENGILDYLIHDKEGKQTKKAPDISKYRYVTSVKQKINTSSYQNSKVPLPFKDSGIWYLKVKLGNTNADAYILRSDIGVLAKEGDNEFIFWGQNFKTKRSISAGNVKLLNLENQKKELQTVSFNAEGIAKANLTAQADIALAIQDNHRAIIPLNLKYLNTGYSYTQFEPKKKETRYFMFTDRPLYKPGDAVYFKAILRDDDDVRYSIPQENVQVKIYGDREENPIFEKSIPVSNEGTINGSYQLPANLKTGYYTLSASIPGGESDRSDTVSFDVEFYKKPEFSIDIKVPKTEVIAGDKSSFKISGTYFSGQPLLNQKVKYRVYSADFYEYQYLQDWNSHKHEAGDYSYRYWYGSNKVTEGIAVLNDKGEAEIEIETKTNFNQGKVQVFSIEATLEDGSQSPAFSRKNMLVWSGEFGIYRKDTGYGAKVNTPLTLPLALVAQRSNYSTAGINLTAKIKRTNWVSYQEPDKKYPSYRKEEETLPNLSAKTDNEGNASFTFTPAKTGSYTITVEGKDKRGNVISKIFYSYVWEDNQPFYSEYGENELTVSTDKQKYLPSGTVRLNIFSQTPDRDVFLSLERGRVNGYEIIHLNGKTGSIDIPLVPTDIPNIFAKVSSFSSMTLDSSQTKIIVSPESKKLAVSLTPNSKTFGPGETVTVNVGTNDIAGNPVSADVALWSVDKAIFELSGERLGNIFDAFWFERYNNTQEAHSLEGILVRTAEMGGGCFGEGTKILMADGTLKNIEDIREGDFVLTRKNEEDFSLIKAKVLKTHSASESGYLIINGNLKITANHILWVNNTWKEAGSIQKGDILTDSKGNKVLVSSVEWQSGKTKVYNLEIENYHTFFAGNIWVHNQKGIERTSFKDTAYWNPSVRTDSSGKAQVSFKLPDNLTTWTMAAVASTANTMVGQATSEITVTKDLIVRPILPNILRVGDEIILSALVQNFTPNDHEFDISLKFDSGSVETEDRPSIVIKSNDMEQFFFKVTPQKESEKGRLEFWARSKDDKNIADIVTQEIPVRPFGFDEKKAQTGEGSAGFAIKLADSINQQKSKITLALSPTLLGTLPIAMKYLIDYPFGCVEQTTSRFVPAVIAKLNADLFSEALKDKDINGIIENGIARLSTLQKSDGGWAWWFNGNSDPFITAYVIEYLIKAKQAGIVVDNQIFEQAKSFLKKEKYQEYDNTQNIYVDKIPGREDLIAKTYALTMLGEENLKPITDIANLNTDILALAVMANYLNGNTDPQTNGLNQLISMAQSQGDALFWEAGNKINFGSRDASTALAIRAILLAGGDRNIAVEGARYLIRRRQSDYWSNTYATAQVISALTQLSKTGSEAEPNYSYAISLDNKQIAKGTVSNLNQKVGEINIPIKDINREGSDLSIVQTGEGQLYSTLLINEFHTDENAKALENGMYITREYVNEKGDYSLAVGDTALVKLTVGGLKSEENYAVIRDELPSGLVPINQAFENEQYGIHSNDYYNSYNITDMEVTENGMVMSLYRIAPEERTYTYRARVVSEGKFIVPPATVSLMYAPEIYGRSEAQTIEITKESKFIGKKDLTKPLFKLFGQKQLLLVLGLFIVLALLSILLLKRKGVTLISVKEKIKKVLKRDNQEPPAATPQNPDQSIPQ